MLLPLRPAPALVGDTTGAFGLDGSVRTIGALAHNYDLPAFFDHDYDTFGQVILRLTAEGRPQRRLTCELHLVQTATYYSEGATEDAGVFRLAASRSRYRALDDAWTQTDEGAEEKWLARAWLDRAYVKLSLDQADLTVGRQAITFGKAYFWNPLDVFLPFDPAQFDRDYKPGVDAVRLDIPFAAFSGLAVVYSPGREIAAEGDYDEAAFADASWYGSALLAHLFHNIRGWDVSLQGGKVYGGHQAGAGLTGEIGEIAVRAEGAQFWADDPDPLPSPLTGDDYEDRFEGVIGLGHRFESSLDLQFEYLYNGAGSEKDEYDAGWVRVERQIIRHLGRHLAGLSASYEFTPLVVGRMALIYSLTDTSLRAQPTLTASLGDNVELLLGGAIHHGDRPTEEDGLVRIHSEFGTSSDFLFAEFKWYF